MPSSPQVITTRATAHHETSETGVWTSSFASKAEALRVAGMTRSPRDDQNVRHKPKPSPVIGRSTNTSRVKAVVTRRQIDMFVSRLSPDTDDVDVLACVMNVMSERYCDDIKCNRLQSKHEDLYSSYHVAVTVDSMHMRHALELLNNPDHWPEGLIARRYFRWLIPDDLYLLNTVHSDFLAYGQSAVDLSTDILVGRPYGGTAILYLNIFQIK